MTRMETSLQKQIKKKQDWHPTFCLPETPSSRAEANIAVFPLGFTAYLLIPDSVGITQTNNAESVNKDCLQLYQSH